MPSGLETFLGIVYTSDVLLAKSPACQNGSGRQRFQEVVPPSVSDLFFFLVTVVYYFYFSDGERRGTLTGLRKNTG